MLILPFIRNSGRFLMSDARIDVSSQLG